MVTTHARAHKHTADTHTRATPPFIPPIPSHFPSPPPISLHTHTRALPIFSCICHTYQGRDFLKLSAAMLVTLVGSNLFLGIVVDTVIWDHSFMYYSWAMPLWSLVAFVQVRVYVLFCVRVVVCAV